MKCSAQQVRVDHLESAWRSGFLTGDSTPSHGADEVLTLVHRRSPCSVVLAKHVQVTWVRLANQMHTARQLGIGSATLYRRLKRYGLISDRNAGPRHTLAKS